MSDPLIQPDQKFLDGKIALVTGAAGGMGSAVCALLQHEGAITVGLDIKPVGEGSVANSRNLLLQCDTGDETAVEQAVARVGLDYGRLDFLVHCAALPQGGVTWKLPVSEWDRVIRANLRSGFLLIHHAIPLMRRSGEGGRIVMIGSTSGSTGRMGQSAYAASKGGLIALTKTIAREAASFDILANIIEPGLIRTPMSAGMPDALRERAISESLLKRMGEPEDIANMVAYLCGPGGRHITGQILRVDGGELL